MIYLIANSYGTAEFYARKHQVLRKDFRYIMDRSDLESIPDKSFVLWIEGDRAGSFDFHESTWKIIGHARNLSAAGRIRLIISSMESAPPKTAS